MVEVIMPVLSLTMEEGTVVAWLKGEGDRVVRDEPLCVVETDKTNMEAGSPATGVLEKILLPPGETVPVRTVIALIRAEGAAAVTAAPAGDGWVRSSPYARKLTRELGLNVAAVAAGSGAARVGAQEVLAFAARTGAGPTPAPAAPPAPPGRMAEQSTVRRITAQRLAECWRTVPHVTLHHTAMMGEAVRFREQLKDEFQRRHGVKLSFDAIIAKAVAIALKDHRELNAQWLGGPYLCDPINLGVAMDTERGLLVPVVHDAAAKSLAQVAQEIGELAESARQGKLTGAQISGGSFTLTNLGLYGTEAFSPIINTPQVAILGLGAIRRAPAVTEGQLGVQEQMTLSLSFDHRAVDGAPAARFLRRVQEVLAAPYLLLA